MLEQSPDQYKTPAEIADKAGITEEEVWRRLGTGQWPAVALGEVFGADGEFSCFDYTLVSAEVVRRMIAQTHEQIEYETSYKTVVIPARKDLIQVLTGPDFTPELFGANGTRTPMPAVVLSLDINATDAPVKEPVFRAQERLILEWMAENKHDAQNLPKRKTGKSTVKAFARDALDSKGVFQNKTSFNKAWERLRAGDEIREVE